MISIDQVLLLEQKVESAVAKIQQLQAENDALRVKCAELTNALSSKSEQLNTYETDQNKIEDGIRKALERLNTIENSVLRAAALGGETSQVNTGAAVAKPVAAPKPATPVETSVPTPNQTNQLNSTVANKVIEANFGTMPLVNAAVNASKPAQVPFTEEIPDTTEFEAEAEEDVFDPTLSNEELGNSYEETSDAFSLEAESPIDSIFSQAEADAFDSSSDDFMENDVPENSEFDENEEVSADFPENNSSDLGFDIF
ncbi:MAG: cell division protein ZapB [Treponema sp.]|nr:cell division protein ZapB [Treponema sp.]